jgi:hypothetical protein
MYGFLYDGVKGDGCRSQKRITQKRKRKNAKTQKRKNAKRKNAKTQKRKNAKTVVDLRSLIAVLNQRFIPFFASKV